MKNSIFIAARGQIVGKTILGAAAGLKHLNQVELIKPAASQPCRER